MASPTGAARWRWIEDRPLNYILGFTQRRNIDGPSARQPDQYVPVPYDPRDPRAQTSDLPAAAVMHRDTRIRHIMDDPFVKIDDGILVKGPIDYVFPIGLWYGMEGKAAMAEQKYRHDVEAARWAVSRAHDVPLSVSEGFFGGPMHDEFIIQMSQVEKKLVTFYEGLVGMGKWDVGLLCDYRAAP
ncbi:MAG: hypothetical protein Q9174_004057 [Haloplaca sp. 1 TL-2023]